MTSLMQNKIVEPLKNLLIGGITPKKLALSMTFGVVLGVFPVMGSTTALCGLAAIVLKLNLPAIQLVNYVIYPAQLALIVPFIRMGQRLMGSRQTEMTLGQMVASFKTDPSAALHQLWRLAVAGIFAWAIVAVVVLPLVYWILLRLIERIDHKIKARRQSAAEAG